VITSKIWIFPFPILLKKQYIFKFCDNMIALIWFIRNIWSSWVVNLSRDVHNVICIPGIHLYVSDLSSP
jgi:hypothetical protein